MNHKTILVIIGFLVVATAVNLLAAQRRSRDSQRKSDVRSISDALGKYQHEFGFLPPSQGGQIVACGSSDAMAPCAWGVDALVDLEDPDHPPYLKPIPKDPHAASGASYYYLTDGRAFQVFAALESSAEAEYDPKIIARGLPCGVRVCNFGLSSGVPLDKSLEEYQNEIDAK